MDYYTRTVFEFVSGATGSPLTVCGGGRYDGLVEEIGGPSMPALGFGLGLERALMVLDAQKVKLEDANPCKVFIAALGEKASFAAFAWPTSCAFPAYRLPAMSTAGALRRR